MKVLIACVLSLVAATAAFADLPRFRQKVEVNGKTVFDQRVRGFAQPLIVQQAVPFAPQFVQRQLVVQPHFSQRQFVSCPNFVQQLSPVHHNVSFNANIGYGVAPVAQFNRFNSFGSRTVNDGYGNVFEVDSFGNAAFRGSSFDRGFTGNAFTTFSPYAVGGQFGIRAGGCVGGCQQVTRFSTRGFCR